LRGQLDDPNQIESVQQIRFFAQRLFGRDCFSALRSRRTNIERRLAALEGKRVSIQRPTARRCGVASISPRRAGCFSAQPDPRASIANSAQHTEDSSPQRSGRRSGLRLGPTPNTAHSFSVRSEAASRQDTGTERIWFSGTEAFVGSYCLRFSYSDAAVSPLI